MTKENLYEVVSNLVYWDRNLTIDEKFNYWDDFWYNIIWNTIQLTILKYDDIRVFRRLLKENATKSPSYQWMDYQTWLELLFLHYPYWHTNWSNCILINELNEVLAVSWNKLDNTTEIITAWTKSPWYIVFNNKKKIHINIKSNELENHRELFDTLSQKIKKIC